MIKNVSFQYLQKKLISSKNRFVLSKSDYNELKKIFVGKNILVTGCCGSIGKEFVKRILKFKFKNLTLLDKNENELTELNRYIIYNFKKQKCNYICSDLTSISIDKVLKKFEINIYLNFAAIKHVRSEENLESLMYMLKTNSSVFVPKNKFKLKYFFSISTDKISKPNSILGVSKFLMEQQLFNFHKKNPSVFVSSTRFANVAFSKGSYLEYAKHSIESGKKFGVPMKISRYFITIDEAVSLCLKSLTRENESKILIPSLQKLKKNIFLYDLVLNLFKIYGVNKKKINSSMIKINSNIEGQKNFEEMFNDKIEKPYFSRCKKFLLIDMKHNINPNKILNHVYRQKSKKDIQKLIKKNFKFYSPQKNTKKVSNLI